MMGGMGYTGMPPPGGGNPHAMASLQQMLQGLSGGAGMPPPGGDLSGLLGGASDPSSAMPLPVKADGSQKDEEKKGGEGDGIGGPIDLQAQVVM